MVDYFFMKVFTKQKKSKDGFKLYLTYKHKIEMNKTLSKGKKAKINIDPNISLIEAGSKLIGSLSELLILCIRIYAYFLLLGQTIYILNSRELKYINLRHIMMKWLIVLILDQLSRSFTTNSTLTDHFAHIIINLVMLVVAYPSRLSKMIHLKYFSHKEEKRYQDSVSDPSNYDVTFSNKLLIAVVVMLLNLAKYLIAFIPPIHRKQVQDSLKATNYLVIQKKSFWNIYDSKKAEKNKFLDTDSRSLESYLRSQGSNPMGKSMSQSLFPQKDVIQAMGDQCSSHESGFFKPIKSVSIKYTLSTSELQIFDIDLEMTQTYVLEEILVLKENIVDFQVIQENRSGSSNVYIKFRSQKELNAFFFNMEQAIKSQ